MGIEVIHMFVVFSEQAIWRKMYYILNNLHKNSTFNTKYSPI